MDLIFVPQICCHEKVKGGMRRKGEVQCGSESTTGSRETTVRYYYTSHLFNILNSTALCVVQYKSTDVSEEHIAGNKFLLDVSGRLTKYEELQPSIRFSGTYLHVVLSKSTDVSEEHVASILKSKPYMKPARNR
jgi:hypothetical protein